MSNLRDKYTKEEWKELENKLIRNDKKESIVFINDIFEKEISLKDTGIKYISSFVSCPQRNYNHTQVHANCTSNKCPFYLAINSTNNKQMRVLCKKL